MFGFRGGESPAIISRKKKSMLSAQARWPFLTNFDCSTIRNRDQLLAMIQTRMSVPYEVAKLDVQKWSIQQPHS
jgi:hypothetical protein